MKNLVKAFTLLAMIVGLLVACSAPSGQSSTKASEASTAIVPGPDINGPGLSADSIPAADPDKPTQKYSKSAAILKDDLGWLTSPTQWNVSGVPSMENYYMVLVENFSNPEQSDVRFYTDGNKNEYTTHDVLLWRNNVATFRDGKFLFTLDADGNWNGKIALADTTPLISY